MIEYLLKSGTSNIQHLIILGMATYTDCVAILWPYHDLPRIIVIISIYSPSTLCSHSLVVVVLIRSCINENTAGKELTFLI